MPRSRTIARILPAVLLAALTAPAAASATPTPTFGELLRLDAGEQPSTYRPDAESRDGTTAAAWRENARIVAARLDPAAGSAEARWSFDRPGRIPTGQDPVVAITGTTVHVAWVETGDGHAGIVLATSRNGGRTFGPAHDVTPRTRDHLGQPRIDADGERVYVVWSQTAPGQPTRLRAAGSRDGGATFPCQARVSRVGDRVDERYDVAVDGTSVHVTWLSTGDELRYRRSVDDGRTLDEPLTFPASGLSVPRIAAEDGHVVLVHGPDAVVLASADGGHSFGSRTLADASTRCPDHHCGDPLGLDLDGGRAVVSWIGRSSVYAAASSDAGQRFAAVVPVSPILYTWHAFSQPTVDVEGDVVSIAWHGAPRAGTAQQPDRDLDPYVASSRDGGATYTVSDADDEAPGTAIFPVAVAHADPAPASGTVWWRTRGGLYSDRSIRYRGIALGTPNAEVLDVAVTQGTEDPQRLVAGRATAVRVRLRATFPRTVTVPVRVTARYTRPDGDVVRTVEEDVALPGGRTVVRHLTVPGAPEAGSYRVRAEVDPDGSLGGETADDAREVTRAVVAGRAPRILVVGLHAADEDPVVCGRVQRLAESAREYLEAAWPIDPRRLRVDAPCIGQLTHPGPLDSAGIAQTFARLDRLAADGAHDRVVAVVPDGWFARQQVPALAQAAGLAPFGGGTRAAILDARASAGWVLAHELAHQLGWVSAEASDDGHLDRVPAPGYRVTQERVVAGRVDAMHPTASLDELADPVARWTSPASWDGLLDRLEERAGTGARIAAAPAAGPVLDVRGTVRADAATLTDVGAATGTPDTADPDGPLALELLDADGAVLATHRFAAASLHAAVGIGTAEPPHDALADAAFSARVPLVAGAARLRLRRGPAVLATRTASAAAPAVTVVSPAAGATVGAGQRTTIRWTATDADGDPLRSTVEISKDGADWIAVGADLAEPQIEVTMPDAFVGDTARVRVTTTDGWHRTTVTSAPFAVRGGLVDGALVTFDHRDGDVWTAPSAGGGTATPIAQAAGGVYPRWSPDGTRIAFGSNDPAIARQRVNVVDVDGSDRRVLSPGGDLWPRWTGPDTIATHHTTDAGGYQGWFDARDDGSGSFAPRAGRYAEPCDLSADGTKVLYNQGGYAVGKPDGTGLVSVPPGYGSFECGSFSPDAKRFVGISGNELAIITVATGAVQRLAVDTTSYDLSPEWSPTGEWIYWSSSRSRKGYNFDVWRIRPDGTDAQLVLDGDLDHDGVEQSSDASYVSVDVQPLRTGGESASPRGPQADAGGPYTVDEGAALTLDASRTTAGDRPLTATRWDTDGDGAHDDEATVTFDDDTRTTVALLATDAAGRSATDDAPVTVRNVAPALHDVTATLATGGTVGVSARLTDPGRGDTHTATVDWGDGRGPQDAAVQVDGGTVRVLATRAALAAGTTVTLTVRDDDGGSASASLPVAPAAPNGAPTADDVAQDVPFATGVDVTLPVGDPEGDRLRVELVQAPRHGRVVVGDDATVAYVPAEDHVGDDAFTYRAVDGDGASPAATVRLRVLPPAADQQRPGTPAPVPPREDRDPADLPADAAPAPGRPLTAEPAAVGGAAAPGGTPGGGSAGARTCVSRRSLTLHIPAPRRGEGAHRTVVVRVDDQVVTVRRGRATRVPIDLRGLPKGAVRVTVVITRASGRVTRSTRTYRTCVKRQAAR
ncbi:hypothetical protein GKE82_12450 [Conexibacter sp. W3-3-2]|uniref:Ig-like domain-containing protein n=1 Tax=Conexibacter sp. W3-3-2 TaxID=2675227 RepID=UPI0012BA2ED4|nr:Ig-like domain-containing protein [Conexibacter sp. W3-3-2]MTD45079.1 hypothetical protein [Conexibacter sp. W3-3-2]